MKPIEVSHINFSDSFGGASIAANRICQSLIQHNIECQLIVHQRLTSKDYIKKISSKQEDFLSSIFRKSEYLVSKYLFQLNETASISLHPSYYYKKINDLQTDIIHLHWVNGSMLSVQDIKRINKPIVWTMHDMWPFSGVRHYAYDCSNKNLFFQKTQNNFEKLISSYLVNKKKQQWIDPFDIVAPSNWMANLIRNSDVMKNWPVSVIKNPIDTEKWQPEDMSLSRENLKLPRDKLLILFGAAGGVEDPRKGFAYLKKALSSLDKQLEVELVIYGGSVQQASSEFSFKIHDFGFIDCQTVLKNLYSACNVFVLPSVVDNLPNTGVESLACGTPVVAFNTGGIPDIVDHLKTGYLAEKFKSDDLLNGIEWVLKSSNYLEMRTKCREKALNFFSYPVVAKEYERLYAKISQY
jgi:glycosyltransferase involved in cell wall biosynthesis